MIHLYGGNGEAIRGIKMANNQVRTIDVELHGHNMPSAWTVKAQDGTQMRGGSPRLSFAFNTSTGKDGDTIKLTITKMSSSSGLGVELFVLRSTEGSKTTLYWGATGSQ